MRIHRLGATVLVMFGVAVAAAQEPSAPPASKAPKAPAPVTVPFDLWPSNHMVVKVKLNGKGPYRLVFDVGAPITLLSRRAAEASGVVKKGSGSLFMGFQPEAKVDTFELGALKVEKLPVIVLDHPALKALSLPLMPIDGIVGHSFFARYRTTIDYQAKTMQWEPVDAEIRDILKALPSRLSGPRTAKVRILRPSAVWGFAVTEPKGDKRIDAQGVTVSEVRAGSPAESAGLKAGDVLTSLDGRWTVSAADVAAAMEGLPPGRAAEAAIVRDGKPLTLSITPRPGL